jgi:hypothetical protein
MALTPGDFTYAQLITGASPSATNSGQILLITEDNVDSTFWSNINNGGGGLRASEDALGVNQLPLDVVLCDTVTEQLIAWTRKPSYTTGDRDVYLFAKNSGTQPAASAAFGIQEVWQDFTLVVHQGTATDSTGTHTVSVVGSPSLVTGMWGGQAFNIVSSGQYLRVTHASTLNIGKDYSLDCWNNAVNGANSETILYKSNLNASGFRWFKENSSSTRSRHPNLTSGNLDTPPTFGLVRDSSNFNGTTRANLVNGSSTGSDTPTGTVTNNTDNVILGNNDSNDGFNRPINGWFGELWLSIPNRNPDRVLEQSNQSDPSTFWTQGTPYDPSGGTIELTGATSSYSYNAINAGIDLTPEITVNGGTASYSYSAINASIELTSEIVVTGQTASYSYSSVNATIELTGIISVIGQTANYSYSAISANIDLTPELVIVGSTATYSYSAVNASVSLDSLISVVGNTASYSYSAVNAIVELAGEIEITGQTSTYSYSAISATITFPTDIFSYADDAITIVLSGNYITKVTYDEFVVKID